MVKTLIDCARKKARRAEIKGILVKIEDELEEEANEDEDDDVDGET